MNETAAKKYAIMLDRLYDRTSQKSINWELDVDRKPRTELGNYIIKLFDGRAGGNPIEYMSLSTQFEEFIETVSDEELSSMTPRVTRFESYWVLMEELRGLAFRQAVGADKALDDVLRALDDDL